jgi:AcrR family transcriptional regulator
MTPTMAKVNTSRPYDSTRRQQAALASRRAVLAAAQRLLETRGYRATTVDLVAHEAGVSPETVYKTWRTKANLAKAVFDVAIAGDDQDVPLAERPRAQAIRDEPDVRRKIALYLEEAVPRQARSARVQLAIRNGQHADPALAELWQTMLDERLKGMTMLAEHLHATGLLRPDVNIDRARDVLWTYIAVELYDLLVLERGWDLTQFAGWVREGITAALVGDR